MDKYVANIKDLVIQALTNGSEIKAKAGNGDAFSCFQMGMIHLLGINTPIDFKIAGDYLGNQSLKDNPDASRLLGFIAECEGKYSQAFHHYEKTESDEKDSYLDKVIKGRSHLQDYLKKLDLPITLNKVISAILSDYTKGKASRMGASIKIATICNDEQTCFEAAKCFYDSNDYISAVQWLKKGNIGLDNPLYDAINKSFEKSIDTLLHSKDMMVVDLEGDSLLSSDDPIPYLNKVKKTCEESSMKSAVEWKDKNEEQIGTLICFQKEKEENERLEADAAEAERRKRRKKIIKYSAIAVAILFFYIVGSIRSNDNSDKSENEIAVIEGDKKLYGVVDKYPITMSLHIEDTKVDGSLYYDKYGPDNILLLTGVVRKNELDIDESNSKGQHTGKFHGTYKNGTFQGDYTLENGKSMPFKVSENK